MMTKERMGVGQTTNTLSTNPLPPPYTIPRISPVPGAAPWHKEAEDYP